MFFLPLVLQVYLIKPKVVKATHFNLHLVGFTGKGWTGHHFQYEQEMLRSDERVHMIDVVKPDKDIKKDKD